MPFYFGTAVCVWTRHPIPFRLLTKQIIYGIIGVSTVQSKFFWSKVIKKNGIEKKQIKAIGKEIKEYARKHGHFTLIEIKNDETEITVTV